MLLSVMLRTTDKSLFILDRGPRIGLVVERLTDNQEMAVRIRLAPRGLFRGPEMPMDPSRYEAQEVAYAGCSAGLGASSSGGGDGGSGGWWMDDSCCGRGRHDGVAFAVGPGRWRGMRRVQAPAAESSTRPRRTRSRMDHFQVAASFRFSRRRAPRGRERSHRAIRPDRHGDVRRFPGSGQANPRTRPARRGRTSSSDGSWLAR